MGRADGSRMVDVTVRFLGDGTVLESFNLRSTDMPIPFLAYVEGVQQLRIEVIFPANSGTWGTGHASSIRYIIQGYLTR